MRRCPLAALSLFVFTAALIAAETGVATAQTYTVLHTFTGGDDGANPRNAGLLIDAAANLYGGTQYGGQRGLYCFYDLCGTIFKLSPRGSGWAFNTLYKFNGETDGYLPDQVLSFGPDGSLYGTTYRGPGNGSGGDDHGTLFRLQPPATACLTTSCAWKETVLRFFHGSPGDGAQPAGGPLVFDTDGNLYGTTSSGGPSDSGTVYKLQRSTGWTEEVLYDFSEFSNGVSPWSGVVFDSAGNLYGTTLYGGISGSAGVVFQLSPSGSGWTYHVLHAFDFHSEGSSSYGGVLLDGDGNLYGTTNGAGPGGGGTVWQLSPTADGWNLTVLHAFTGHGMDGPRGNLLMDAAGSLYGTTEGGGAHGWGTVFKLSRSGQGWDYTSLYDFTGDTDGARPAGQLVMDAARNIYGTTFFGGFYQSYSGFGVVFKISDH